MDKSSVNCGDSGNTDLIINYELWGNQFGTVIGIPETYVYSH